MPWVHSSSCESLRALSNLIQPTDIFGCICSTYFHNIACYKIAFYQFSELDEQLTHREKKCRVKKKKRAAFFFFFFPCVDLNDLTAITAKQTVGDNSCTFGQAHRLTPQFPEKTFCSPRHVTSMSLSRRCVWMSCHKRGVWEFIYLFIFFIWLKRSRFSGGPRYWFGPVFSYCGCLSALDFAFLCGGDTCRVQTATWQNVFLNSWSDGGPPDKKTAGAHKGLRKRCHASVWFGPRRLPTSFPMPLDTIMMRACVRARRLLIDWELNLSSPGKCGLIEDAADRFLYGCRRHWSIPT